MAVADPMRIGTYGLPPMETCRFAPSQYIMQLTGPLAVERIGGVVCVAMSRTVGPTHLAGMCVSPRLIRSSALIHDFNGGDLRSDYIRRRCRAPRPLHIECVRIRCVYGGSGGVRHTSENWH